MMRLSAPAYSMAAILDSCVEGITGNAPLKASFQVQTPWIVALEAQYRNTVQNAGLATIAPLAGAGDPVVVGTLTKSDFRSLYDYYLLDKAKSARKIYDHILNAAEGKCPYCGGLGSPRNLDHHLPVAHFPQFSVLPFNLVPSCRDCNMDGKPAGYATVQSDQIIQPYLDHDRFFDEQWISGRFVPAHGMEPNRVDYVADPPATWNATDRSRAKRHFEEFALAGKYATQAAVLLGATLAQVRALRAIGFKDTDIIRTILTPGEDSAPFVNHWFTGMYQALRLSVAIL